MLLNMNASADDKQILGRLNSELMEGLRLYWQSAGQILAHSAVKLAQPPPSYYSEHANFFSILFLYSYYRQGIASDRRVFYVAVNQCLRGMVTGCDNLLDNEYKMTLDTDLPSGGVKFRSILDIMVSDRVLFKILLDFCTAQGKSLQTVIEGVTASLHALVASGAQEASEEAGITGRIGPQNVLDDIHHLKTGLLFKSPWAIPAIIENDDGLADCDVSTALYKIGMGCQVMDDMVDLLADVRNQRHNYVASLIEHGPDSEARQLLHAGTSAEADFYARFPDVFKTVHQTALDYLYSGLSGLYLPEHQFLLQPAAAFITERIGVNRIAPAAPAR